MRALALAAAIGVAGLAGCATHQIARPQASLDNIQTIRAGGLPPLSVGFFTPAPGAPTTMDRWIPVRGGVNSAPEGSFATYLADTLKAELQGAGRLDPAAPLTVSAVITDTHLASMGETPNARLAARFTLSRSGQTVFTRDLSVSDRWDFEYLGAIAIPDAFDHYAGLFPKLVGKLLADLDFAAAAKTR